MYLFILPPVAWFHLWVDMFLSMIGFLCCSIWHMFPERRVLHDQINTFNRIAGKVPCVIIVAMVVLISQMIEIHFAWFPSVEAHCVGRFVEPFQWTVVRSEVADSCDGRVTESFLMAALLMLCRMHECTTWYSSTQQHGNPGSISFSTILKYLLLLHLPARRLHMCDVPWIPVRTGVALDRYTHCRCQHPYYRNHCQKCEQQGHDAVHEQISVRYYRASSQNHHPGVVRQRDILSWLGSCGRGVWFKHWSRRCVSKGSGRSIRVQVQVQIEPCPKWLSGLPTNRDLQLGYGSNVNSQPVWIGRVVSGSPSGYMYSFI